MVRLETSAQMDGFVLFRRNTYHLIFVDFREETNLKDLEKYELLVYPHAAILTKEARWKF